jgi:hypothetical protein
MKITLDIPDALAEQLRAEAEARGEDLNRYAVAKLEKPADTGDIDDTDTEEEADDDLIEALRDGLAQADAGQLRTLEQVEETVRAALAARHHQPDLKAAA